MKPDLYDSMASAASGEGISLELVRRAKRAGCDAFRGSRVDGEKLRHFIAAHADLAPAGGDDLKEQKLTEEVRKLRIRNDRDESKVVLRIEIAQKLRTCLGRMRGVIEQKIINEFASKVAGMEPAQIRIEAKKSCDEAMMECASLDKEFS